MSYSSLAASSSVFLPCKACKVAILTLIQCFPDLWLYGVFALVASWLYVIIPGKADSMANCVAVSADLLLVHMTFSLEVQHIDILPGPVLLFRPSCPLYTSKIASSCLSPPRRPGGSYNTAT